MTRDELIDQLQQENIRLKKELSDNLCPLCYDMNDDDPVIKQLKADHKAMKEALRKYGDLSNWSYYSNHDVGAFKEEWTMFKQNCRGPDIAKEVLSNLQYKKNENGTVISKT